MSDDDKSLFNQATTIATMFNSKHGHEWLKVVQPHKPLTESEVRQVATESPGWYMSRELFVRIRGRRPSHGEAIATGHVLRNASLRRKTYGPFAQYLLGVDSDTNASAD